MTDDFPLPNQKLANLLNKLNKARISISCSHNEILVKYPKNGSVDKALLEEVKKNKDHLLKYFQYHDEENAIEAHLRTPTRQIIYEGSIYYEITPTQTYWLDEKLDQEYKSCNKMHGACLLNYEVTGIHFEALIFERAVRHLIERHESLRSTFHFIRKKYFMKVEDIDLCKHIQIAVDINNEGKSVEELYRMLNFQNYDFDLANGPLFFITLVYVERERYIISIKIHHIICDGISLQILLRDLIHIYFGYANSREILLPKLKYQYKDYLALTNYLAERNYEAHKNHWCHLFSQPPSQFIIPGVERVNFEVSKRILKEEFMEFPADIIPTLLSIAKRHNVTLFLILQALFNAFLYYKMGKNDILVGTYVTGRDFAGTEDQIGCYAKTVLIRTVLEKGDSFSDIIKKVKKSNEDMSRYTAFSLEDLLENTAPPERRRGTAFQNINLLFADISTAPYYTGGCENLQFRIRPFQMKPVTGLISEDMQLCFLSFQNNLQIKFQYDGSLYNQKIIQNVGHQYIDFAGAITRVELARYNREDGCN